jgi:putative ABC transport system ATP-binding protein
MNNDKTEIIRLTSVSKTFGDRNKGTMALDGVSLSFERGTFTAIMGPSGSGKSTLLNCASGLDKPSSGTVMLAGQELTALDEKALTKLRRTQIGFVFQLFNLMPALDVTQNITLPLRLAGKRAPAEELDAILRRVGLQDRRHHRPHQLSGGQQQRVAIARALITRPAVIFGDEPTGALDTSTALEILGLLREAVNDGRTVAIVTHDPVAASHADRVVFLADGKIVDELHSPTAKAVAEKMTRLGAWSGHSVAHSTSQTTGMHAAKEMV